jgi:hypothetical protein
LRLYFQEDVAMDREDVLRAEVICEQAFSTEVNGRTENKSVRKTLNYETPAERFHQSVASTC